MAKSKKKAAPNDRLLQTIASALQPIPYWVGHKHARFASKGVQEAAITTELRESLQATLPSGLSVRTEISYGELSAEKRPKTVGRPEQADLAVWDREKQQYVAIIEVKRGKTPGKKGRADILALAELQATNPKLRRFFILVTEAGRPGAGVTAVGTADTKIDQEIVSGRRLRVRRVSRAISHAGRKEGREFRRVPANAKSQHWVVLYEIS